MKLWEFKNTITQYLRLLKAIVVYTFQTETAYWANNLFGIVGTLGFAFTNIVFAEVVFYNVNSLAGYNKDELIFFYLIGYLSFFFNRSFTYLNLQNLIYEVNTGGFDLLLVRPVSSLLYSIFRRLSIITFFKEGIIGSLAYVIAINWSNIHISFSDLISGILLMIIGQVGLHFLQFCLSIPVFWFGESSNISALSFVFDYRLSRFIPFEGLIPPLQVFFSTVIPVLVATGISTSVFLGKSSAFNMLIYCGMVAIVLIYLESLIWKQALKNYSSASS